MMELECDLTISFASAGNSLAYLGGGWARSEPEFSWSIGGESHLMFPPLKPADEYLVTLDVVPFIHLPEAPGQRLIVSINDTVVGSCDLSRPTLLGYRIPAAVARQSDRMVVTLQHPDAVRPKDFGDSGDDRYLAFAMLEAKLYRVLNTGESRRHFLPAGLMLGSVSEREADADVAAWATERTGLSISELAFKFESVGENCEFGLFQRRCDAEPLGLLRFSSTFMRNLIRGVESGFADLGEQEDIDPRLEGGPRKEFMIHEQKYGLVYHTFVYEGERSVWLMREQEAARLKFLRRKFIEELEAAEKIFVYRYGGAATEEQILPLLMALTRYGPATLLWVVAAERGRPPGTVEVLMPGLMKGYMDRFAPEDNAHDLSFDGWLRLCANACVLHDLHTRAVRAADRKSPAGPAP
jgi:hypothetical protein